MIFSESLGNRFLEFVFELVPLPALCTQLWQSFSAWGYHTCFGDFYVLPDGPTKGCDCMFPLAHLSDTVHTLDDNHKAVPLDLTAKFLSAASTVNGGTSLWCMVGASFRQRASSCPIHTVRWQANRREMVPILLRSRKSVDIDSKEIRCWYWKAIVPIASHALNPCHVFQHLPLNPC